MVMGVDESEHSFYALEWTLNNFFAKSGSDHPFKLVIVHARRTPASVIGVAGPGKAGILLQGFYYYYYFICTTVANYIHPPIASW